MLHRTLLLCLGAALAGCSSSSEAVGPRGPRILVMVSIDQLRPDQLARLQPQLDPGGLGRLLTHGRDFQAAALPYASTSTGPGHATMGTGTLPHTHGITDNTIFDRQLGQNIYCFGDAAATGISNGGPFEGVGGQRSVKNCLVPALGAHLQEHFPGAKVVSISGKDRSAIGLGGATASPCLWWERKAGMGLVTSDAFEGALPRWTQDWNRRWVQRASGWVWESTIDPDDVPTGTDPDDRVGETNLFGQGRTFPYQLMEADAEVQAERSALAEAIYRTPYVDMIVGEAALASIEHDELGFDEIPDLLCLGFSAVDTVGHGFGPYSQELTDTLLRLDAVLKTVFDRLDETVGEDGWVLALSADHGVLPLPEGTAGQALGARRVTSADINAVTAAARRRLRDRYGDTLGATASGAGLVLSRAALAAREIDLNEAAGVAAAGLADEFDWIDRVLTHAAIGELELDAADPFERYFRAGWRPDRGTDLRFLQEPGVLVVTWGTGTSHGSAHDYDRRVPLWLMGPGIEPGSDPRACGNHDLAPTLLDIVGVSADERAACGFDGRSLLD